MKNFDEEINTAYKNWAEIVVILVENDNGSHDFDKIELISRVTAELTMFNKKQGFEEGYQKGLREGLLTNFNDLKDV